MLLNKLLSNTKVVGTEGDLSLEISGISYDSRKVKPGYLFVAVPGFALDGTRFIPQAVQNGASAVITEKDFNVQGKVAKIVVPSARAALADVSCAFFDHPSRKLKIIGITGTNGKTTTAYIINSIFKAAGIKSGLIGTVEMKMGDVSIESKLTTPESADLQKILSDMAKNGATHVVMEVSSHSLSLKRVRGIDFDVAVYTNLSHDHLDFHKTMESYFDAKLSLFRNLGGGSKKNTVAVVNMDDDYSETIEQETQAKLITYSTSKEADVSAKILRYDMDAMALEINLKGEKTVIETCLVGPFNASNVAAAFAAASSVGISKEHVKTGIEMMENVPGRLEKVRAGQDFMVIVDFAHSPDSLQKLLDTVKPFKKGKFILVFGCTGDRDKAKRPIMGAIAKKGADIIFLTTDDPHNEDPLLIIKDVESGIKTAGGITPRDYIKEPDRKAAIEKAIRSAKEGDIVLIAGRGHEKLQEIKGKFIEIDDRIVARDAVKKYRR
ncbi:MAG: UDP-N-acetylmuramoyl-L-alanyl-D-glutamate--2,6-diaminopimelate ligase [Candidatus Margulisiibacteriota bacterium]